MKNRVLSLVGLVAAVAVIACDSDTTTAANKNVVTLKATMTPGEEVPTPSVASTATGSFIAQLDTVTGQFIYDVTYQGLTTGATAGHIHGPAAVGVIASPLINFATLTGATFTVNSATGTAHGATFLTSSLAITATINGDSLKKLLLAGQTYANIHTSGNSGGEIRGQIIKQ
jgi:hypothetical protein